LIKWSERLYFTTGIGKKLEKIRKKLEKPDKLRFGAYLITLNNNGSDLFDIYNILMFPAKHFKEGEDVEIVGVAKNEQEAKELTGAVIKAVLAENVSLTPEGLKGYFGFKAS